jgi:hypothetical protein
MPIYEVDGFDNDDEDHEAFNQRMREQADRQLAVMYAREMQTPHIVVRSPNAIPGDDDQSVLVEGGVEVFNTRSTRAAANATSYHAAGIYGVIDNGLPLDPDQQPLLQPRPDDSPQEMELLRLLEDPKTDSTQARPGEQRVTPARVVQNSNATASVLLERLGLGFLTITAVPPPIPLQIVFEGKTNLRIPFSCHHVVTTDNLVVLVTDTRSSTTVPSYEVNIGRDGISACLLLPDGEKIAILPPVPKTQSFDLGVLRCTLFARVQTPGALLLRDKMGA